MLELLIIIAVGVVVFGHRKLPKLAREIAQAPQHFQNGRKESE